MQAKVDLVTAYTQAAGEAVDNTVSVNLTGQTLLPGVYNSASSMDIAVGGTLTIEKLGDPLRKEYLSAILYSFIYQIKNLHIEKFSYSNFSENIFSYRIEGVTAL